MLDVYLAVRPGVGDPGAVARDIVRHRPDARLHAVWGGDPHRRPLPPVAGRWADIGLSSPGGPGWELLQLTAGGRSVALAKAVACARAARGPWVVLAVGDLRVDGDVAALVPTSGWGALEPASADVPAAIAGATGADASSLAELLASGRSLDGLEPLAASDAVLVSEPAADDPDCQVLLPGGLRVDDAIRVCVSDAVDAWRHGDGPLPPEPFTAPSEFRAWLESPRHLWEPDAGRYWTSAYHGRPDLLAIGPRPDGVDFDRLVGWAERRWWIEPESVLLRTGAGTLRPPWTDAGREHGINLVGYLGFDKSLGDVARRIASSLEAAGEPFGALDYLRSGSPRSAAAPPVTTDVRYDVNLCVVNADSIANLMADYGDLLRPGRGTIGYWFWELEEVPERLFEALDLVDEIWVATEFVADAFRRVTALPVRVVPIPVPAPAASEASRAELGLPDDRFVFLMTFDYLSVAERKNPVGAIEAFRRAFPETADGGPVLVVKSLNAGHRPDAHRRTLDAAADRPDVLVRDEHLTRDRHMAMISAADCLVSLHRSEGLGLHIMEAMWLGTPAIATRYSGNIDFMDDDNSLLIDAGFTTVVHGEGAFQEGARWADPDLDAAARAMADVASDPALCERLAAAGRRSMESQPTLADTGRTIADLAGRLRQGAST